MIATHICPHCAAFLVAMDAADMVTLRETHHCAAKQDRNTVYGFDVEVGSALFQQEWRNRITVEDARFLAAMKIDPL